MTNDKGAKKTKVDSNIEKLEERIAPGGIGGLVGDLGVESSAGNETILRDEDVPSSISPEITTPLETTSPGASPPGGEGDLPFNDGSGSKTYVDSVTETSDGQGGGAWEDRQGNTQNWNVDGSGTWSSSDGSSGYQNADGSGGYSNTDGSYGSYVSDGSSSHTESNGVAYQQNADGTGSVTYPDGTGSVTYPDGIGDTGDASRSPMVEGSDGTKQTESDTTTYEDGTVETWNQDGSGSAVYVDGTTETWDGHGGGTWNDGTGKSHTWNDDGSGTWVDPDGRSGYQNANGSGGYNNADGSYGTYDEDGSGTHTETDGARWTFKSDGSGTVTFLDGTTESWGSPEGSYQDGSAGVNGQQEDSQQEAIQEALLGNMVTLMRKVHLISSL